MDVELGVRVVRGPDWSWEDQDGGEGSVGTVVDVKLKESTSATNGQESVFVCWDIGVLSNYRCGFRGKYDVRVYDNGQTGVSHPAVTCDGCSTSPVYGMRWKCATCYDYDLCTECYMSNKHSLEHHFLRYDTPRSEGIPVPARSGGRRIKAKGFFKGAVVSRGKDWKWGDQDGGESDGSTGVVKEIKGWHNESFRSIGEVQWESSNVSNVYRVGHKGKVDLKCDTPGDGGEYYPDHLPMSGGSTLSVCDESVAAPLASTSVTTVGINTATASNTTAKGTELNDSQNILNMSNYSVSDSQSKRSIHKDLGFNVYQRGDVVRVIDDLVEMYQFQGFETWNDDMALTLGQLGQVMSVEGSGDCIVKVNGFYWMYDPKSLVPAPGETPPVVPVHDHPSLAFKAASAGDVSVLKTFLSRKPEAVDLAIRDRTALHVAACSNYVECVKVLLEYHATVNIQDSHGVTPLHWACHHGSTEGIKLLLDAGADPANKDGTGTNCLHKCVQEGCLKGCELILECNPELLSVPDATECQPLHLACLMGKSSIAKFFLEQDKCDVNAVTEYNHTALHLAVKSCHPNIAELCIGHGVPLNVASDSGLTALHQALRKESTMYITDNSPELTRICSTLSDLPSSMKGSAAVACLLVREGADLYRPAREGRPETSPLHMCPEEVALHLFRYTNQKSTFHGSLRRSPKPTPAALVEEENTPELQKTAEESSKAGECGPVTDVVEEKMASTNVTTCTLTTTSTTPPLVSAIVSPTSTSNTTTTTITVGLTINNLTQNTTPNMTAVGGVSASTSHNSGKTGNSSLETEKQSHTEPGSHKFQKGDVVRVTDDPSVIYQLQGPDRWDDDVTLCLGHLGRVAFVDDKKNCFVKVNGYFWEFHPKVLIPAPGEIPPEVPVVDCPGLTHHAAYAGDMEVLRSSLLHNPGRVNLKLNGATPLHWSALSGQVDCVRLLLEYQPIVDVKDSDGDTALNAACCKGHMQIIEILLEAGADPSIGDQSSINSLHMCADHGCLRGCELILARKPSLLNSFTCNGYSPLHLACDNGHFKVAEFLVQQERCDIDAITEGIHTALHLAVDKHFAAIVELLVGHGIDLDVIDERGLTALHIVLGRKSVVGIPEDSPELTKICSTLSDLPDSTIGSAAVACLLVREGADLYCKGGIGKSPLETCAEELASCVLTYYTGERSTFHGSLRKSPKPTSADLVEEEDTSKRQKTVEESSKSTDERGPVGEQKRESAVAHNDKAVPMKKPTVHTANDSPSKPAPSRHVVQMATPKRTHTTEKSCVTNQGTNKESPRNTPSTATPTNTSTATPTNTSDDDEACLLCDEPIDVRIEPCGHTVLCRSHANTAKRCPQCRVPIHSIADLEPLCGMCQENVCSVTLKPCDHMMCSGCALRMKCCFECKTKITSKEGLQDSSQSTAVKSESDPTSITTIDSSVSISDESLLCEICVSNKKTTAFTCGHQLCYDCSLKVDKCPICREEIKFRIKLH